MVTQTFFQIPFASSGDTATIPGAAQSNGSISFTQGYSINYQEDPNTDPSALEIDRLTFNELMLLITQNIQVLQVQGLPTYIPASQNGGSPYPYGIGAMVQYEGVNYISLINNNTNTPPYANAWGLIKPGKTELVGTIKTVSDPINLPAGYIWANGQTIGNASSNATSRANVDTQNLFNIYWSYSAAVLPLYNSSGAPIARGASASADFAANNAIAVPNLMGRVVAGLDGMGSAPTTNLLTVDGSNISGVTPGASGGSQNISITSAQNGPHTHGPGSGAGSFRMIAGGGTQIQYSAGTPSAFEIDSPTTGISGSGAPIPIVQPTFVLPIIISLGTV